MTENLPPGRELDALVAEKVMGRQVTWEDSQEDDDQDDCYFLDENGNYSWSACVPRYSTDIAAAWQVVEKLDLLGVRLVPGHESYGEVSFSLGRRSDNGLWVLGDDRSLEPGVEGESAPHAICLAALKVVQKT